MLLTLMACSAAFAAFAPNAASAQTSLAGEWLFVLNSPVGTNEIPLVIEQDGETLNASLAVEVPADQGGDFVLQGTLSGERVRFFTEVDFEGMPLEINLSGTASDSSMSGSADYGGMAQGDWSARRVEP